MSYHEKITLELNNSTMKIKTLAEKVGVSERTIIRWRQGEWENMGIDKLKAICECTGKSADELLEIKK